MTSITTDQFAPAEQVAVDGVTCEVTGSRSVLDTDRDGPWHSGRWPIESWFIVSNLDSGGQRLGLQLQFQIQTPPSGADAMQLDVVVVNASADISRNFEYLYPRKQVELSADRMYISTPQLTFGGDRHGCAVSFRGRGARIDIIITTTTAAPPVLMNGQGQFFFIDVSEQYEFAFPGDAHDRNRRPRQGDLAGHRPRLPRTRRQLVLVPPQSSNAWKLPETGRKKRKKRGETMTNSVARSKALKRHLQGFLTVVAACVAAAVLAACGPSHTTSGGSSHQHTPAPTHIAATTPPAAVRTHTANPIPQGNGGDHDADNNGGPSDGDGNI